LLKKTSRGQTRMTRIRKFATDFHGWTRIDDRKDLAARSSCFLYRENPCLFCGL